MKEIARREGVDDSYVSRMVNLTTLAPDLVAPILDDTLPSKVTLFELAAGKPLVWGEQRKRFEPDSIACSTTTPPSRSYVKEARRKRRGNVKSRCTE
jgi:hypothetical protein